MKTLGQIAYEAFHGTEIVNPYSMFSESKQASWEAAAQAVFESTRQKPERSNHNAIAKEILLFLNDSTQRNYAPVDANLKLIVARLKEGADLEMCKRVIFLKVSDWSDSNMATYLRPKTLFNSTNFWQYQGELVTPKNAT